MRAIAVDDREALQRERFLDHHSHLMQPVGRHAKLVGLNCAQQIIQRQLPQGVRRLSYGVVVMVLGDFRRARVDRIVRTVDVAVQHVERVVERVAGREDVMNVLRWEDGDELRDVAALL